MLDVGPYMKALEVHAWVCPSSLQISGLPEEGGVFGVGPPI